MNDIKISVSWREVRLVMRTGNIFLEHQQRHYRNIWNLVLQYKICTSIMHASKQCITQHVLDTNTCITWYVKDASIMHTCMQECVRGDNFYNLGVTTKAW